MAAWPAISIAQVAAPSYRAADFVAGAYRGWFAPRAAEFAAAAGQLRTQLQAACASVPLPLTAPTQARQRWQRTALAWERLAAVAVGPLLERRSPRQVDFWPVRPDAIARAIQAGPRDLAALERVGTPAKGLGALEWLLWMREQQLAQGGCEYAALLAAEVHEEAQVLAAGFQALAQKDWNATPPEATEALAEILNQWIGGLEALRWQRMERPSRSAQSSGPAYPRSASGFTGPSWAARWEALTALGASGPGRSPPGPGGGVVPVEAYLRGRGQGALANRLAERMGAATAALGELSPTDAARVASAAGAIARAKQLAEAEIAPALDVALGFSDSDGD